MLTIKDFLSKQKSDNPVLHTLYQQAKESNIRDLEALAQQTVFEADYERERKEKLREICLKHQINSPLLGDE
jgi:GAF domain-containing protein